MAVILGTWDSDQVYGRLSFSHPVRRTKCCTSELVLGSWVDFEWELEPCLMVRGGIVGRLLPVG